MRELELLRDLRVRTLRAVQVEALRPVRPLMSQGVDNAYLDTTKKKHLNKYVLNKLYPSELKESQ